MSLDGSKFRSKSKCSTIDPEPAGRRQEFRVCGHSLAVSIDLKRQRLPIMRSASTTSWIRQWSGGIVRARAVPPPRMAIAPCLGLTLPQSLALPAQDASYLDSYEVAWLPSVVVAVRLSGAPAKLMPNPNQHRCQHHHQPRSRCFCELSGSTLSVSFAAQVHWTAGGYRCVIKVSGHDHPARRQC